MQYLFAYPCKNYNSAAFFFRPPFMSEWAWILWNKMHSIKMHLLWYVRKNKYSNNTARRFPSLFYKKNQSLLTILAKNNNIPIIISLYIPWHFLALFKFKHTCNSSCQQAVFLFVFQLWVSQRQRWEGWTISPMFHWYKLREKSNYKG